MPILSSAQSVIKQSLNVNSKKYSYYEMTITNNVKGILILLPAAGENPKSIFNKTKLPELIANAGYVTIAPEVPTEMYANEECIAELDELIKNKFHQYSLDYKSLVIGGLSDGGSEALSFVEYLNSLKNPINPKAVFAIDPPADLFRIYGSAQMEINYNCPLIKQEGKNVKSYLEKTCNGSPETNINVYREKSVFSAAMENGGNARFLSDVPVRLYCEPDLEFVQKTYCPELEFFNLNAYDLEALIKFLKVRGNERSEYITTKGKGFHSWNIVDSENCVKWISGL
jgi:hypothetical protein